MELQGEDGALGVLGTEQTEKMQERLIKPERPMAELIHERGKILQPIASEMPVPQEPTQHFTPPQESIRGTRQDGESPKIFLPSPDELSIELVRSDRLKALEQHRADEQKWFSITTGLVGVLLGMISQVLGPSSSSPDRLFWILFLLIGVLSRASLAGKLTRSTGEPRRSNRDSWSSDQGL